MEAAKESAADTTQFALINRLVQDYTDRKQIREVIMDIFMVS